MVLRSLPTVLERFCVGREVRSAASLLAVSAGLAGCAVPVTEERQSITEAANFAFVADRMPNRPSPRGVVLGDRMIYRGTGAGWYQVKVEHRITRDDARSVAGERVSVTIGDQRCSHGTSLRVTIRIGDEQFDGCGGASAASSGLANTTWVLRGLQGRPAPDGRSPAATITFASDGTFGGTSSCNDVSSGPDRRWQSGAARTTGQFIFNEATGPISGIQTVMGCPDPTAGEMGGAFWQAMRGAVSWRREGERLIIEFKDGSHAMLMLLATGLL